MKNFFGGAALGAIAFILLADREGAKKNGPRVTVQVFIFWSFLCGLAAWGLL